MLPQLEPFDGRWFEIVFSGLSPLLAIRVYGEFGSSPPRSAYPSSNRSTVVGLKLYFQVSAFAGNLPYCTVSTGSFSFTN